MILSMNTESTRPASEIIFHITKTTLKWVAYYTGVACFTIHSIFGTELLIRAQDDDTLGGLNLKLVIPQKLEEGPKGLGLEVVAEGNKKALLDQDGKFISYQNVDRQGQKIPGLVIQQGNSPWGSWPPRANKTQFDVMTSVGKTSEYLDIYISRQRSDIYYARYQNYFYPISPQTLRLSASRPKVIYPTLQEVDLLFRRGVSQVKLEPIPVQEMPFFDAVSIFGAVWYVFDMYTKDIDEIASYNVKDRWKKRGVTQIYPSMSEQKYNVLLKNRLGKDYDYFLGNAFFLPVDGTNFLCFFPFSRGNTKNTGQSSDIVMHETGHNVLYILRSDLRGQSDRSYDNAAFDESFGDLTAFFALASIREVVTKILAATKGNLETSSFFSVLGETLLESRRDAAKKTNLSQMPSCEEHEYSERFTRAIYGTLADGFNLIKRVKSSSINNDELLFMETAQTLRKLFLRSVLAIPADNFSFPNFGRMLEKSAFDAPDTAYFTGLVFHNFAKQSIDLNNKLWSPMCSPNSMRGITQSKSGRQKWVCSTSFKPKILPTKPFGRLRLEDSDSNSSTDSSSNDTDSSDDY